MSRNLCNKDKRAGTDSEAEVERQKELATQVGGGTATAQPSKFLQVVAHEEPRGNAPAKEVTSQDAEEAAEQQVGRKGHHGGAAAAKEFYEATRRVATQFSPEIAPASPGEDTILGPNYAIEEWLDDMLQEGYGSSYGSIFRSEGVDDTDQLSRIKPRQVSSILSKVPQGGEKGDSRCHSGTSAIRCANLTTTSPPPRRRNMKTIST